ncbi:hypothetical protein C8T65DRAFT_693376 [Cerioporus squamosus]|nr:hypothetical protein C8T65DRAFT_693376 [Cerioporus squamosus]
MTVQERIAAAIAQAHRQSDDTFRCRLLGLPETVSSDSVVPSTVEARSQVGVPLGLGSGSLHGVPMDKIRDHISEARRQSNNDFIQWERGGRTSRSNCTGEKSTNDEQASEPAEDGDSGDDCLETSISNTGYLSDLFEDVEDVLPDGDTAERNAWCNEDTLDSPHNPSSCADTVAHPSIPNPSTVPSHEPTTIASNMQEEEDPSQSSTTQKRRAPAEPENAAKVAAATARQKALVDIKKRLNTKKDLLVRGLNTLQSYRVRAVQSCLHQMVHDKSDMMEASVYAARGNMFSSNWGARLIRQWMREWVKSRTLPKSQRGRHVKIFSILSDPTVPRRHSGLSQDPPRLKCLLHNELTPSEAEEYTNLLVSEEMPNGLKRYVEDTAIRNCLVHYEIGGVTNELPCPADHVGPCLVLVAHDEMTAQAHNGKRWSWLLDEKFFPAFRKVHGEGFVAVILVDNSQGHSCYADDTLRVSQMNFRPAGAQARMRNGWYMKDGEKVTQPMVYPADHPEYPDKLKV